MATLDYDKIINGIRKALYGYEVREYLAQSMEWTKAFVTQSVEQIKDYLRQAEAARDAAKASQDAAKVSETNAKASETNAKASENAASNSASAAKTSEVNAKTSETNAKASEDAAKASETAAASSASDAASSASAARESETNAKASENAAADSASEAKTSEANAKTSETNAKASADSMDQSVETCTAKANEAADSAIAAKTSETNAKASETNAKESEDTTRQLVEDAKKVVNTDKTLTIDGAAADAKVVGEKFNSIKTDWDSVTDKPDPLPRAVGLKDYAGDITIQVGYATAGLTTDNLTHIAGYTDNGTKIKDVSKSVLQSWLGIGSGALTSYPVGSIYMSTNSTSPASLFGGTWTSIASERVLMGVSSSHGAGSTVSAGLPNIKGAVLDTWHGGGPSGSGALSVAVNGRSAVRNGDDGTFTWGNFYFDAASYNSIYGNASTVQPAAYYVYMWRRAA